MKHYKTNTKSDVELYETLDAYDYADFDDDYYFDMVEERIRKKKSKKIPRESTIYSEAFINYTQEFD